MMSWKQLTLSGNCDKIRLSVMSPFKNIINKFKNKHLLVIGDIILDQYIRGSVTRISPEAPVPIVLQEGQPVFLPGGAANVARNLRSLSAKVSLVGRVGPDEEGRILKRELKKARIHTRGIFLDSDVPTALKSRIIASHQQVVRLDREKTDSLKDGFLSKKIKNFIRSEINSVQAIIISDYGKGLMTEELLAFVCSLAIQKKKIITVDPKVEHFSYYQRVTAITPNRSEMENAIRNIKITQKDGRRLAIHSDRLRTDDDIDLAGTQLLKFLDLECLLMTLGEAGMRLFERAKRPVPIETRARDVFDVTGAGDTVISVFTLSLTAGATKHQAADLSNYAAGIVVGKLGAVTVTPQELLEATKQKS